MTVAYMRSYLKTLYHGAWKWQSRVDKMSDAQIIAVYNRIVHAQKQH